MDQTKEVIFQLKGIDLLDVQLKHPEKSLQQKTTYQFDISIEHRINHDKKLVIVICAVTVLDADKSVQFGSLKASCIFEVTNMEDFTVNNQKQVKFPIAILTTFNSITISTVRGIMFSHFKGTFLHNALLPIVNPQGAVANE